MLLGRDLVDTKMMEHTKLRSDEFKEKGHCRTLMHCWE
jgi:hypothetical protein